MKESDNWPTWPCLLLKNNGRIATLFTCGPTCEYLLYLDKAITDFIHLSNYDERGGVELLEKLITEGWVVA